MRNLSIRSILFVCFSASALLAQASSEATIRGRLLAEAPPSLTELAKQFPAQPLTVDFLKADLDGSGRFRQIIAFYSQPVNPGLYLRVFVEDAGTLKLIGEQEDQDTHGAIGWHVSLVDIDNDGIPELDLSGTDSTGQRVMHEYFRWTGRSLHELLDPTKEMAADAALEDVDGDGTLKLVVQHGPNRYVIYKYNGADFVAAETLNRDPLGTIAADGSIHKVRAFFSDLNPSVFSINEVQSAIRSQSARDRDNDSGKEGTVRFLIGRLRDLNGNTIAVEEVDTGSLILSRGTRPLSFKFRPDSQAVAEGDTGTRRNSNEVLELEFARADILRLLPQLKLTAPLTPGDKLHLLLYGKLKDGTRVSATASALVKDRHSQDEDHDRRAPRDEQKRKPRSLLSGLDQLIAPTASTTLHRKAYTAARGWSEDGYHLNLAVCDDVERIL